MHKEEKKYEFGKEALRIARHRIESEEEIKGVMKFLHYFYVSNKLNQTTSPSAAGTVKEDAHYCDVCNEHNGTLANEDDTWMCEDCAQIMSDFGHEASLD